MEFDGKLKTLSKKADAVLFGTLAQRNEVSRQTIKEFAESLNKAVVIFVRASKATALSGIGCSSIKAFILENFTLGKCIFLTLSFFK